MSATVPVFSRIPNLLKELVKVSPSLKFHFVEDPDKDLHFKQSEVLICDFDLLGNYLYELPKAKWVQGTWAGIDKLTPSLQPSRPLTYQITRFTGDHFGKQMSEYVIANIVNHERDFFRVKHSQQLCSWNVEGKIRGYRIISDLTVGILGLGNIGNRIGRMLNALGAEVMAFGRRAKLPNDGDYAHVCKYFTKKTLPELLQTCDYIVSVLPNTQETTNLLDCDVLKNCAEKQSVFINIGRSNVISEDSLIKAIRNKWISAAILDVFDVEPLPASSPLWQIDEVFVTPHVAAVSRARDIAEQFKTNYDSYLKNEPLAAVIDFTRGY